MANFSRDINFFFELGTFRRVDRMWKQVLWNGLANDAEHTFRVIWLAITIAKYEENVDIEKLMKIALIHDLWEIRTWDKYYLTNPYVKMDETKAIQDIISGTAIEQEFEWLIAEYKKRESIEAKIVKDADTLDVDIELTEQKTLWNNLAATYHAGRVLSNDSLYLTQTWRKMAIEVLHSDPNSWHLQFLPYRLK